VIVRTWGAAVLHPNGKTQDYRSKVRCVTFSWVPRSLRCAANCAAPVGMTEKNRRGEDESRLWELGGQLDEFGVIVQEGELRVQLEIDKAAVSLVEGFL